jgi:hypothetical protein
MTEEQNLPALLQPSTFDGTDLVPTQQIVVQRSDLVDIDPEEMPLPIMRVGQGQSEFVNARPDALGKFYVELTDDVFDSPLRAILLSISKGYILLPDDTDPEQKNLQTCYSDDRKQGIVYGDCQTCGMCDWNLTRELHGRDRPWGSETWTFYLLTQQGVVLFTASSSSAKEARRFAAQAATMGPQSFPVVIRLKSATKTKDNGKSFTYYTPLFSFDRSFPIPREAQQQIQHVARQARADRKLWWESMLTRRQAEHARKDGDDNASPEPSMPF